MRQPKPWGDRSAAVPALAELLKKKVADLRLAAADALGNVGPEAKAAVRSCATAQR